MSTHFYFSSLNIKDGYNGHKENVWVLSIPLFISSLSLSLFLFTLSLATPSFVPLFVIYIALPLSFFHSHFFFFFSFLSVIFFFFFFTCFNLFFFLSKIWINHSLELNFAILELSVLILVVIFSIVSSWIMEGRIFLCFFLLWCLRRDMTRQQLNDPLFWHFENIHEHNG